MMTQDVRFLRALLEAGVDPQACNEQGKNALTFAHAQGYSAYAISIIENYMRFLPKNLESEGKFKKQHMHEASKGNPGFCCSICMEDKESDPVDQLVFLPCGHEYCPTCIASWKTDCPTCKAPWTTF